MLVSDLLHYFDSEEMVRRVLILVLVDVGLGRWMVKAGQIAKAIVLILVLVDVGLGHLLKKVKAIVDKS